MPCTSAIFMDRCRHNRGARLVRLVAAALTNAAAHSAIMIVPQRLVTREPKDLRDAILKPSSGAMLANTFSANRQWDREYVENLPGSGSFIAALDIVDRLRPD